MKFRMRCPSCGHGTMHHGEEAELRDVVRCDVFSCRGCGSAFDEEDIREIVQEYQEALAALESGRRRDRR